MKNDGFDRRAFLKSAVAGSAAAATVSLPRPAEAQPAAAAPASQGSPAPNTYAYLNPDEAAFVEAMKKCSTKSLSRNPPCTPLPPRP